MSSEGNIVSKIYPDLQLVHFKGHGEVSYDMIIENIIKLHRHPQWNYQYNTFIDFEDVRVKADLETAQRYDSFFTICKKPLPRENGQFTLEMWKPIIMRI